MRMRALPLWSGLLLLAAGSRAGTVQFQITDLGGPAYRYNYFLSGFNFQVNQELDIKFDPALFGLLSNGVAGPGFSVSLFQPDNPPGTFGDYSALAVVNNPPLTGPFRVDVIFKGAGRPGAQPFLVNQFDANFNFLFTIESGTTIPLGSSAVPEPGTVWLGGGAVLMGCVFRIVRRRAGVTV